MQTYGGRWLRTPNSWLTTDPNHRYWRAGLGGYPVNMLWVPRSWAASPWVIDRQMASLSATWAVCFRHSLRKTPSSLVWTTPISPRYSIGAFGFGSHDSWWAAPPGRKMWITDFAFPSLLGESASARADCGRRNPSRVRPRPLIAPTWRKVRRLGGAKCDGSSRQVIGRM